jgi:hypothetical protein
VASVVCLSKLGKNMKKALLIILFTCSSAFAGVTCSDGTWNGTTCAGAVKPVEYTITCTANVASKVDTEAVIADADLGDTMMLPPLCVLQSNTVLGEFEAALAFKKAITGGTGYFTVTSTEHAKLPAEGIRINPSFAPLMPIIQDLGTAISSSAAFWSGANPIKHVKLRGLNIRVNPAYTRTTDAYAVVDIGGTQHGYNNPDASQYSALTVGAGNVVTSTTLTMTDTTGMLPGMRLYVRARNSGSTAEYVYISTVDSSTQVTIPAPGLAFTHVADHVVIAMIDGPEFTPDDIWVSQCLITAPWMSHKNRGFTANGRNIKLTDSYVDGFMRYGAQDSQGIFSVYGVGPFTFTNNWIHGNSENWMAGGASPAFTNISTLMSANQSVMRFNSFAKIREREYIGPYSTIIQSGDIVWRGRHALVPGSSSVWMKTLNTGVAGDAPVISTVIGSQAVSGTLTWETTGPSEKPNPKNFFETKDADNILIEYNSFGEWQFMSTYNTTQPYMLAIKASNQGCPDDAAVWPTCHRAASYDMKFLNNTFRMTGGSWASMLGCYVGPCVRFGNHVFRDNLVIATQANEYGIFLGANQTYGGVHQNPHEAPFTIEHNTFYSPGEATKGTLYTEYAGSGAATIYYPRNDNVTRYNIFPGSTSAYPIRSGLSNATGHIKKWVGCDAPCPQAQLHKNWSAGSVILTGTPTDAFRNGCTTLTTNCTAPAAWDFSYADGKLFRSTSGGDFRIRPTSTWARTTDTGRPIGADLNEVPLIKNLRVTTTDTTITFNYQLTNPIKNVSCALELHGAPDFESSTFNGATGLGYSAELSDMSTYYARPIDSYIGFPREGNSRTIVLGTDEPLTPLTTYFYRLHCGGDFTRGSATTRDALSGTTTKNIIRVVNQPTVATMAIEYGTAYNRTTGVISSGGTASTACTVNTLCTVPFTANKGDVYYWRWIEKNGGGTALKTSKVSTMPVVN